MAAANEIIAATQRQIAILEGASDAVDAKIGAIKDADLSSTLSAQQLSEIAALRATQKQVLASIEQLACVTMEALDDADEITRLSGALAAVVQGLETQSAKIADVDAVAKQIGFKLGFVVCDRLHFCISVAFSSLHFYFLCVQAN